MKIAVILLTLCAVSRAWSTNGHLYVANIAEVILKEVNPRAYRRSLNMLSKMQEAFPEDTYREVDHPFVEAATFADDAKYSGESWQGYFHYINLPWVEEGQASDYDLVQRDQNITAACNDIIAWISRKQGKAYKKSYIFTYLMDKYAGDFRVAKSFAFRMLIHYIGDLEQPFHTIARYSPEYPRGDRGANDFDLPSRSGIRNLHYLWDKVLYAELNNIPRPISQSNWDKMQVKVASIFNDHSDAVADMSVYADIDIDKWAQENFEIAKTLYEGVTENQTVPQAYIDKYVPLAYERMLIGGYRLAAICEYMFIK